MARPGIAPHPAIGSHRGVICPEDGATLGEEGPGRAGCPACRGTALSEAAFAAAWPGLREALAPETDEASGGLARLRRCPRCGGAMVAHRIGDLLAWVEVCAPCGLLWVEKLDQPVLGALRARRARERAAAAIPAADRREMAAELAGEVAGHERGLRRLRWVGWVLDLLDWR